MALKTVLLQDGIWCGRRGRAGCEAERKGGGGEGEEKASGTSHNSFNQLGFSGRIGLEFITVEVGEEAPHLVTFMKVGPKKKVAYSNPERIPNQSMPSNHAGATSEEIKNLRKCLRPAATLDKQPDTTRLAVIDF